ncbi:MAG: hypothetical protein AAF399_16690, partial [Bacteroidota bacterium]
MCVFSPFRLRLRPLLRLCWLSLVMGGIPGVGVGQAITTDLPATINACTGGGNGTSLVLYVETDNNTYDYIWEFDDDGDPLFDNFTSLPNGVGTGTQHFSYVLSNISLADSSYQYRIRLGNNGSYPTMSQTLTINSDFFGAPPSPIFNSPPVVGCVGAPIDIMASGQGAFSGSFRWYAGPDSNSLQFLGIDPGNGGFPESSTITLPPLPSGTTVAMVQAVRADGCESTITGHTIFSLPQ